MASSTSKLVEASTTSAAKGSVTTAVPSALASVRRDEERISEVASGTNFMVKNNEYLPAAAGSQFGSSCNVLVRALWIFLIIYFCCVKITIAAGLIFVRWSVVCMYYR